MTDDNVVPLHTTHPPQITLRQALESLIPQGTAVLWVRGERNATGQPGDHHWHRMPGRLVFVDSEDYDRVFAAGPFLGWTDHVDDLMARSFESVSFAPRVRTLRDNGQRTYMLLKNFILWGHAGRGVQGVRHSNGDVWDCRKVNLDVTRVRRAPQVAI